MVSSVRDNNNSSNEKEEEIDIGYVIAAALVTRWHLASIFSEQ